MYPTRRGVPERRRTLTVANNASTGLTLYQALSSQQAMEMMLFSVQDHRWPMSVTCSSVSNAAVVMAETFAL